MSKSNLNSRFEHLKRDLMAPEGPRITNMRNYRFAIVPYLPEQEFELRKLVRRLNDELRSDGWNVLEISMQKLMMKQLRELDDLVLQKWTAVEKMQYERDPGRALARIKTNVGNLLEGEDGIAADMIELINDFAEKHPDQTDNTLIWIKRLGALYPFSRCSSLLKLLDGKTRHIPVVVLYPGVHEGQTALSFMGELEADRDYRPSIYS